MIFYRDNCADMALYEDDIDPDFIASAKAVLVTGTHFSQPNTDAAQQNYRGRLRAVVKRHSTRSIIVKHPSVGEACVKGRDMLDKTLRDVISQNVLRDLNAKYASFQTCNEVETITNLTNEAVNEALSMSDSRPKSDKFFRQAVINPDYLLNMHGIKPHIFLINSRPGTLGKLIEQISSLNIPFSRSIIYGEWDMIIVFWSIQKIASELLRELSSQSNYIVSNFEVMNVPVLFGKLKTNNIEFSEEEPDIIQYSKSKKALSNETIESFKLINKEAILGVYWSSSQFEKSISAFIGITISGTSEEISSSSILEKLSVDIDLMSCIVDFYEILMGRPYHYIIKVIVPELSTLDRITDFIGTLRIGRAKFDGVTHIVASETVVEPRINDSTSLSEELPNFEGITEIGSSLLNELGTSASMKFNLLDPNRQVLIIKTIAEIKGELHREPRWDKERGESLSKIVRIFSEAILDQPNRIRLVDPAVEIGREIEGYAKSILRDLVEVKYGREYALAQRELRLPVKDFRKLSLGKALAAFESISKNIDYTWVEIDQYYLENLRTFSEARNEWAHESIMKGLSSEKQIESVRRMMLEAIILSRWFGKIRGIIESRKEEGKNAEEGVKRKRTEKVNQTVKENGGVFLSHSSKDKEIAEKVARGIQALGKDVWYSDWSLNAGESIVEKVGYALKEKDTLVILLSKSSVVSSWVKRELNSSLMAQLSGRNIRIIPVLIESCDVPEAIKDIVYIDMARDYKGGLIELLNTLK